VQRHDRPSRILDVSGLVVGLEEAGELEGDDLLGQDPARRVLAEPPARPHIDDVGDLVGVEPGVLGLELHDHASDVGLQAAALGPSRGRIGREEAPHPVLFEALDPAVHGALGDSGLPGPLRHRGVEKDQRGLSSS
jgi:hypothetical protein